MPKFPNNPGKSKPVPFVTPVPFPKETPPRAKPPKNPKKLDTPIPVPKKPKHTPYRGIPQ